MLVALAVAIQLCRLMGRPTFEQLRGVDPSALWQAFRRRLMGNKSTSGLGYREPHFNDEVVPNDLAGHHAF